MGFLKKIIKAPIKLHKKALKTGAKVAKKTTPGLGGGKTPPRASANTPRAMANTTRASATRKAPAMGATGGMSRTKVRGQKK